MSRPNRRHLMVALLMAMLASMLLASPAGAHRIEESYIYVDVYDTSIEGRLEFNAKELNSVLGLAIDEENVELAGPAAEAARSQIAAYAEPRFGIGTDGTEWSYDFGAIEVFETENGVFAALPFDVNEAFAQTPTELDVRYEIFMDEVAGHAALFHIETYWEGAIFAGGENPLNLVTPFSASNTNQTFDLDDPSFWNGFQAVVKLGVDHIKIGTDHILFIMALLLPSVLIFTGQGWQPSAGFKPALWRVTKLATMFTVAHSITLSLAGFGIISLPAKPVEVIIALSIIAAALHNLHPIVANKEWAIAFGFGLFHGLGFAGLLGDLGLDRSNEVWSLLAFNLGVEVGQLAIILLTFPALYLLRRTRMYVPGMKLASVAIAVIAFGWMIERVWETDLGVNRVVDPITETPRAYAAIAVFDPRSCCVAPVRGVTGSPDRPGRARRHSRTPRTRTGRRRRRRLNRLTCPGRRR